MKLRLRRREGRVHPAVAAGIFPLFGKTPLESSGFWPCTYTYVYVVVERLVVKMS